MFKDAILPLIQSSRISNKALAIEADITESYLTKILTGERTPTYHLLQKFADIFKVDPAIFFPGAQYLLNRTIADDSSICTNCIPKYNHHQRIYSFLGGLMIVLLDNPDFNTMILNLMINNKIEKLKFNEKSFDEHVKVSYMWQVNKGRMIIGYPHYNKILYQGQVALYKGSETFITYTADTNVNIYISHPPEGFSPKMIVDILNQHQKKNYSFQ